MFSFALNLIVLRLLTKRFPEGLKQKLLYDLMNHYIKQSVSNNPALSSSTFNNVCVFSHHLSVFVVYCHLRVRAPLTKNHTTSTSF